MNKIIVELPLYYEIKYKTKKNKKVLVGMNNYRNWHYHLSNEIKTYYTDLIFKQLNSTDIRFNKYKIEAYLYYKNQQSDLDNSCSVLLKFLNDALQKLNIVKNDNVKYLESVLYLVVGKDVNNPRVEFIIEPI
jgi:Holliday junction resolvase RusA-like endonuclease